MTAAARVRLPSRYEDLDPAFRASLRPNPRLLELVKSSYQGMQISGGVRFLPIYGKSGSGKSSAAFELATHLPEAKVVALSRAAVESRNTLETELFTHRRLIEPDRLLIAVIDQYEEAVAARQNIPTQFVETVAMLDRGNLRDQPVLFLWLTTSREFQGLLARATSRNRRVLVADDFELSGPQTNEWPEIIEETFRFHNQERTLADYEVLEGDLEDISRIAATLGDAIEDAGRRLAEYVPDLHDMSTYQVVMLWPVSDGLRITRVQQFTDAREGYRLDWNAWHRRLNRADQQQLPLRELNRTRLYFDLRLVPIAVADLHMLCKDLEIEDPPLPRYALDRFKNTHFFRLIANQWNADAYTPMRERESKRAEKAREWYEGVTTRSVGLGRRIAHILSALGVPAHHEQTVVSPHGSVRADIRVPRQPSERTALVELKAFSPEQTMPSTICTAVLTTLRRHAQLVGFLQRQ